MVPINAPRREAKNPGSYLSTRRERRGSQSRGGVIYVKITWSREVCSHRAPRLQ